MKPIDWDEIMSFWNSVFDTKYTLHKQMLKAAYKMFPSLKELALKLDVSHEVLREKLMKEGVKIKKQGQKV